MVGYNLLSSTKSLALILFSDCKYDEPPYSDCDPFHLVKWRTLKLLSGPSHCESTKNDTKQCSSDQFPPGLETFASSLDATSLAARNLNRGLTLKGLMLRYDVNHFI